MKGIICAGGEGTRLYPLTRATNKHLLPVYDKPMIYYPIQTLVKAGIDDILIVVGGSHAGDFISVLQNGEDLGIKKVNYAYQRDGRPGIADAISYGETFANGESVAIILGDNTTDADISNDVKNFNKGAKVFLKKVLDPHRFGVPVFDNEDKIVKIEEKPADPKSAFAVTGLYLYDNRVFDIIRGLKPSSRGELEVTDINNFYIRAGELEWSELDGFWSDAGTCDTLYLANKYWFEKFKKTEENKVN